MICSAATSRNWSSNSLLKTMRAGECGPRRVVRPPELPGQVGHRGRRSQQIRLQCVQEAGFGPSTPADVVLARRGQRDQERAQVAPSSQLRRHCPVLRRRRSAVQEQFVGVGDRRVPGRRRLQQAFQDLGPRHAIFEHLEVRRDQAGRGGDADDLSFHPLQEEPLERLIECGRPGRHGCDAGDQGGGVLHGGRSDRRVRQELAGLQGVPGGRLESPAAHPSASPELVDRPAVLRGGDGGMSEPSLGDHRGLLYRRIERSVDRQTRHARTPGGRENCCSCHKTV